MDEEKKPGFFKRTAAKTSRFIKDLKGEMKKVVWPSKKQVVNNTGIVIVVVVMASAGIGLVDVIFHALVSLFV